MKEKKGGRSDEPNPKIAAYQTQIISKGERNKEQIANDVKRDQL